MSGYGESRTFETHPGAGGEESEALGLPFVSTSSEDWYGWGDTRSENRYKETGNIEIDIESLKKWVGLYSLRSGSGWAKINSDELYRKQAEVAEIQRQRAWLQLSDEEQQRQQRLVDIDKVIVTLESELLAEQKSLSGFHPTHYIRGSIEEKIRILEEKITQKKTRN